MRFAALLGLVLLVTGCAQQRQIAPRLANSVRFDLAADPTNLNPLFLHQDAASVEQQVARLAFLPFIDLDQNGRALPELLSQIPTRGNGGVSSDGRTIVYHLRAIHWNDGVPVTARDVLFTLKAIMNPEVPVASREGYDLIDRAIARDTHTVVLHLRRAWAPAVTTFFSYGFRPQFVLPQHVLSNQPNLAQAAFNANPSVGDGPFNFVSWHRGDSLLYVANPRYWRGKPQIVQLDIRIVPDPGTNLLLLRSGQLDWNLIAPAQQALLAKNSDISYRVVRSAVVAGIVLNVQHPPLDDIRVRRAIAMSIDRQAISRKITLGRYPVTNALQPQFSWAFDSSVREPQFDPKGADEMLDAAGWKRGAGGVRMKNGTRLSLVYVQFPETVTGVRVATMVQSELRQRGIDASIKSISNAQLFIPKTGILAAGKFDMAYVPYTMGSDPDDSSILQCGAPSNYMRYCSAAVNRLESAALSASSQSQRRILYSQIEHTVARDLPIIFLFNANYVYAYRKELRGFYPNAFLPAWNAAQWRLVKGS